MSAFWAFLNSGVGLIVVASLALMVLKWIYTKYPKIQTLIDSNKGWIIQAVKWAEKTIPDTSENKNLKRADEALQYFIKLWDAANPNKQFPDADKPALQQAINVVHAQLEKDGNI